VVLQLNITVEQRAALERANPNYYTDFVDLLDHMLTFNPKKRWTATQCLDSDLFRPHRAHIARVRAMWGNVTPFVDEHMIFADCHERVTGMNAAVTIFNKRSEHSWYSHRILFLSLSIFNRYLNSAWSAAVANGELRTLEEVAASGGTKGQLLDLQQIYLYYYVCLYMAVKFFYSLHAPPGIYTVLHPYYHSQEYVDKAVQFEKLLVSRHLRLVTYQDTPYEILDRMLLRKITDQDVGILLEQYVTLTADDCKDITLTNWVRNVVVPKLENTKGYILGEPSEPAEKQVQPNGTSSNSSNATVSDPSNVYANANPFTPTGPNVNTTPMGVSNPSASGN